MPNLYSIVSAKVYKKLTLASAAMSTTYGGYVASNLIDGDTNNFAHTAGSPTDGAWIRVYLAAAVAQIDRIIIYNRVQCCRHRSIGWTVYIKIDDTVVTSCGQITQSAVTYDFTSCTGRGNIVEMSIEGAAENNNLAEFVVYGSGTLNLFFYHLLFYTIQPRI